MVGQMIGVLDEMFVFFTAWFLNCVFFASFLVFAIAPVVLLRRVRDRGWRALIMVLLVLCWMVDFRVVLEFLQRAGVS